MDKRWRLPPLRVSMAVKWLFLFVFEGNRARARKIRFEKKKNVPWAFVVCQ